VPLSRHVQLVLMQLCEQPGKHTLLSTILTPRRKVTLRSFKVDCGILQCTNIGHGALHFETTVQWKPWCEFYKKQSPYW